MISLALLLAAAIAAAPSAPARDVPLEIAESGEISYEPGTGRWFLSGGAVLKRGEVTLRASTARYDPRTGEIEASGGVLLLERGRALSASSLHAVVDGPFEARDVIAFTKEGPLDLAACRTLEEVGEAGTNRITVGGARVSGTSGDPGVRVVRPRVTLCDCGAGPPSWEVRGSSASVVPGRYAWITWPVFWITPRFLLVDRQVPVFALPAVYLPLAERQSGLLLPSVTLGRPGFGIPLFLAPAEWWDATVTYEQVHGDAVGPPRSVRGKGGKLELRWAPTASSSGVARLSFLRDEARDAPGARPHGDRLALSLRHDQAFGADTALRLDAGLVNDPFYALDFTADALLRASEYRRSSLWLARRLDDAVVAVEAGYHLTLFQSLGVAGAVPFGTFGSDLSTLHRLPSATATLLPVRLGGPLVASASASVSRFAPLRGAYGDEGADGRGADSRAGTGWTGPDAGERDGRFQPGERLAATRAALRAEGRAPLGLGEAAVLEPWAAATGAGYAFEGGLDPRGDVRAAGGIVLGTRLTRRYARLRHDVEPRLEWRAGAGRDGLALPVPSYDELDGRGSEVGGRSLAATPAGGFQQATLSVRNRLSGGAARLDLTLGQDLDLDRGRLAEAHGALSLGLGPLRATGEAGLHPDGGPSGAPSGSGIDAFSFLRATAAVTDRRGELRASIASMGPSGSERVAAGLEPIFDPRPAAVRPVAFGSVGATLRWSGASVSYDAAFNARDLVNDAGQPAPLCAGKTAAPHVYQHSASLGWTSPCKCFTVAVVAVQNECFATPVYGFSFGIQQAGGPVGFTAGQ